MESLLEEKAAHLRDLACTHDQLALLYEELGKWGTASGERERAARLRVEAAEVDRRLLQPVG